MSKNDKQTFCLAWQQRILHILLALWAWLDIQWAYEPANDISQPEVTRTLLWHTVTTK